MIFLKHDLSRGIDKSVYREFGLYQEMCPCHKGYIAVRLEASVREAKIKGFPIKVELNDLPEDVKARFKTYFAQWKYPFPEEGEKSAPSVIQKATELVKAKVEEVVVKVKSKITERNYKPKKCNCKDNCGQMFVPKNPAQRRIEGHPKP